MLKADRPLPAAKSIWRTQSWTSSPGRTAPRQMTSDRYSCGSIWLSTSAAARKRNSGQECHSGNSGPGPVKLLRLGNDEPDGERFGCEGPGDPQDEAVSREGQGIRTEISNADRPGDEDSNGEVRQAAERLISSPSQRVTAPVCNDRARRPPTAPAAVWAPVMTFTQTPRAWERGGTAPARRRARSGCSASTAVGAPGRTGTPIQGRCAASKEEPG